MLEFEKPLVFLVWNKSLIELYTGVCTTDWIRPFRDIRNLSFKHFSFDRFYLDFWLNDVTSVDYDLEGINLWIIFDNQFSLMRSRSFSSIFELETTVVRSVGDECFIVNGILQSKLWNCTFDCPFYW